MMIFLESNDEDFEFTQISGGDVWKGKGKGKGEANMESVWGAGKSFGC